MNVAAIAETMKGLRASLLQVESARSAGNAMLKVTSKSTPETATQMATMMESQVRQIVEQLKAAAALADALSKLVTPTPAEPEKPVRK